MNGLLRPAVLALTVLLPALVMTGPPVRAEQDAGPSVLILLDGSGSMWGRMPGDPGTKLSVSRDALKGALDKLPPGARAGFASFGSRRRGDCSDAHVAVPLERPDQGNVALALEKHNPIGRGPIALGLREAIKALAGAPSRASIVLVHDDPDNCQQDPCEAAAELAAGNPGVPVHVVSLAPRQEDAEALKCVADRTRGRFFAAHDADAVRSAIDTAMLLAAAAAPSPASRPVARVGAAAGGATPADQGGSPLPAPKPVAGITARALLAKDGRSVSVAVGWRVLRKAAVAAEVASLTTSQDLDIDLPPGGYLLEATAGLARETLEVEVAQGRRTVVAVPLQAAHVMLATRQPAPGGAADTAIYTISAAPDATAASSTRAAPLWIGPAPAAGLVLPAGIYRVTARRGLARSERSIVLPANSRSSLDIELAAGRLALQATYGAGGRPVEAPVDFVLRVNDPDEPSGLRDVVRASGERAVIDLPAGTYTATARLGLLETTETFAVLPGEVAVRQLALASARLRILGPESLEAGVQMRTRVLRSTALGGLSEVARSSGADTVFDVPPGTYRIEARIGRQNAVIAKDLALADGGSETVRLQSQFGIVQLSLRGGDGGGDALWQVRDGNGVTIWREFGAGPRLILAAGRYTVIGGRHGQQAERAITLEPGQQIALALALN